MDDDGLEQVNCLGDVKRVIKEFMPGTKHTTVTVKAEMRAEGKKYAVEGESSIDYKKLLMEGFSIVKARTEAAKKIEAIDLKIQPINLEGHMWLDDMIRRRMGGKRDGLRVRWDLEDGTYFFDPFACKLTKGK